MKYVCVKTEQTWAHYLSVTQFFINFIDSSICDNENIFRHIGISSFKHQSIHIRPQTPSTAFAVRMRLQLCESSLLWLQQAFDHVLQCCNLIIKWVLQKFHPSNHYLLDSWHKKGNSSLFKQKPYKVWSVLINTLSSFKGNKASLFESSWAWTLATDQGGKTTTDKLPPPSVVSTGPC